MECYWFIDFLNKFRNYRRYIDLVTALENCLPYTCPEFIKVRVCIVGEYTADIEVYIDFDEWNRIHAPDCKWLCKPMSCYRHCIMTEEGKWKCKKVCVKRVVSKCYIRCMKEAYNEAIWWLRKITNRIEKSLWKFGIIYEMRYDNEKRPTKAKFRVMTTRVEDRWMLN